MTKIQSFFHGLWQSLWGLPQTLLGLGLFLRYRRCPRKKLRGEWAVLHNGSWGGVSLGLFLFVPGDLPLKREQELLAHEYGHALQSLLLGPLYLLVIGLPSFLWANLPCCRALRRKKNVPYEAFYPERWAENWGRKVLLSHGKEIFHADAA